MTKLADKRWKILSEFFFIISNNMQRDGVHCYFDGEHLSAVIRGFRVDENLRIAGFTNLEKGSYCQKIYDECEIDGNVTAADVIEEIKERLKFCIEIPY